MEKPRFAPLPGSTAVGVSRFGPVLRFTCRVNGGFIKPDTRVE